jgi:hypothetical protein
MGVYEDEEDEVNEDEWIKIAPISENECIKKINDIVWNIIEQSVRDYIELILGRSTGKKIKGQELLIFKEGKFTRDQILLQLENIQSYSSFIENYIMPYFYIEDKSLVEEAMYLMDLFKDALEKDQIEDVKLIIEGPLSSFLPYETEQEPLSEELLKELSESLREKYVKPLIIYPTSSDTTIPALKNFLRTL